MFGLRMKGTWRVVVGLLFFWLLVLLYMSTTLYQSSDINERTERQLSKALQELDALKRQNLDLQNLASELRDIRLSANAGDRRMGPLKQPALPSDPVQNQAPAPDVSVKCPIMASNEPDLMQEKLRRRADNGVTELWYYLKTELTKLKTAFKDNIDAVSKLHVVEESTADRLKVIHTDLYNLSLAGNMDAWRQQEARELSDIVQNRIHYLQNPADCSKAKKLVCHLNKGCGYGCQLHHMVYCFIIAYGTQRTMILDSHGWRYAQGGWEKVFLPLSETCTDRAGSPSRGWGPLDQIANVQVVDLPIVDSLHPRPPYMPLAIPRDLASRLERLHGNPIVWWIGQFLKYSLKPQTELAQDMAEAKARLKFMNPIVGVHVRRTDKVGTEAAFHGLDEYMWHVEEFYKLLEKRQTVDKRRVYLATDDSGLLQEAMKKFPSYHFISDNAFSQSAGLGTRYSDSSLRAIILDIHFLSLSDYLVCTFSSQVCRVAYEIMQTMHTDASDRFHSLDDIYYYGGQNAHNVQALYEHTARDGQEIDLRPGDLVGIAGNHWDGYSKGMNRRNSRTGLFPSYKTENKLDIVDFPTYVEADKLRQR